jgi:hypothetical protein
MELTGLQSSVSEVNGKATWDGLGSFGLFLALQCSLIAPVAPLEVRTEVHDWIRTNDLFRVNRHLTFTFNHLAAHKYRLSTCIYV